MNDDDDDLLMQQPYHSLLCVYRAIFTVSVCTSVLTEHIPLMSSNFIKTPLLKNNIPVIMGLLGVWNMSFMGYNARTTLPSYAYHAEALL